MRYKFDWSVLWTGQSGEWLLSGLLITLELSALAWLLAVVLGVISGALRTVAFRPLRGLATFYVEFFRNVPLLVWMFFWYFAVPPILPEVVREFLFTRSSSGRRWWRSASTAARGSPRCCARASSRSRRRSSRPPSRPGSPPSRPTAT